MADEVTTETKGEEKEKRGESAKSWKSGWLWPVGVMMTSLAGAGLLMLRGCWHRRMSWPLRAQGYSYQVCLGCGAKRLFDEKRFSSHGPFRYDLNELIAWEMARREESMSDRKIHRPAS